MRYVYTGPSWAASSYPIDHKSTNLAQQWGFEYHNVSKGAHSVLDCVNSVRELDTGLPVIWIYNEPLIDLKTITGLGFDQFMTRPDWLDIWHKCNDSCLEAISSLDVPVLLIGAHSDVIDCHYPNITVGCASWQKWLAQQANMPITDGVVTVKMDDGGDFLLSRAWGAEILHKFMHQHPEVDPVPDLVNNVWDIFFFWKQLEKADLFFEVHPNRRGNELFAEYLLPTVTNFLREHQ